MITEIGIVAGEIWHFLDKNKGVSLDDLIKGIDKPREVILMSLGWLAREGHVNVKFEGNEYKINLKSEAKMKKGVILVVVMGILIVLSILALVGLYLISQESRIAEHKIRRMKAFYAAQAGMVIALEELRRGNWTISPTSDRYYCLNGAVDSGVSCSDTVSDSNIPYNVQVKVGPQGGGVLGTSELEIKVEY